MLRFQYYKYLVNGVETASTNVWISNAGTNGKNWNQWLALPQSSSVRNYKTSLWPGQTVHAQLI